MTTPSLRCWAEINLPHLAFNLRRFRSLAGRSCEVIGVVKADAYGHGLPVVARRLWIEGVRTLAVANIAEAAVASRTVPGADILLLSPMLSAEIPAFLRHPKRWMPTLSSLTELRALEKAAARARKKVRVHVKLDTGMGRLGGFADEALRILQLIASSHHLSAAGLYSHFASADVDRAETLRQLERLQSFCRHASAAGIAIPPLHFQNSAGTIQVNARGLVAAIRPGLSLYGIPTPAAAWRHTFGPHALKPVLAWKTRVALIRDMPRGATISYANTFRAPRPMRVAVLAAGYADGVSRKLSNRGEVLIHGKRCRILGRVTMDMTMVDVTRVPRARWGDEAVLIGRSGKDEITAHEMATWAETNAYEVLCNISRRVLRVSRS